MTAELCPVRQRRTSASFTVSSFVGQDSGQLPRRLESRPSRPAAYVLLMLSVVGCGETSSQEDAATLQDTSVARDQSGDLPSEDAGAHDQATDGPESDLSVSVLLQAQLFYVDEDANIEAIVTGGTPPYSYAWMPSERFPRDDFEIFRMEPLPGDYTTCVTVTDNLGASASDYATHTVHLGPTVALGPIPAQVCVQSSPLTISFDYYLDPGTEPHQLLMIIRPSQLGDPGNVMRFENPTSPITWDIDAGDVGDWEVYLYASDADRFESQLAFPTVIDCP